MQEKVEIKQTGQNSVERVLDITLGKLKNMAETSTVIGAPIKLSDGSEIIPISKVTMGYVGGGGEHKQDIYNKKGKQTIGLPFAGGSGAALTLSPIGFLVGCGSELKIISLDNQSPLEKFIDVATNFISKEAKNYVKKD